MKIKICGISRDEDIDHINEAMPDYTGFVFAPSKREVSPAQAAKLRRRLADGITPVGVFVNAPVKDIIALYHDGVISIAQLHGNEDEAYIKRLKETSVKDGTPLPVIKVIRGGELAQGTTLTTDADYYLVDSGAGSGLSFDWNVLNVIQFDKPWFLAGGINAENIRQAMSFNPFCIDISGGAETDGVKDREKIVQLAALVRKYETSFHIRFNCAAMRPH
jgi:phosphoribosylanthranilate isomerase